MTEQPSDPKQAETSSKKRLKWRYVVGVFVVFSVSTFGYQHWRQVKHDRAVKAIEDAGGSITYYRVPTFPESMPDIVLAFAPHRWLAKDLYQVQSLGGKPLAEIIEHLCDIRNLKYVNLESTRDDLSHVRQLQHLESLTLSETEITESGFEHLASLKHLKSLWLINTQVSGGMRHLSKAPNLRGLSLDKSEVEGTQWVHLRKFPRLHVLSLIGTTISDNDLRHMEKSQDLQFLHLEDTGVTDAGLSHLDGLKRLEKVYLENTFVTAEGIAKLHASKPEVEIFWDRNPHPRAPPQNNTTAP